MWSRVIRYRPAFLVGVLVIAVALAALQRADVVVVAEVGFVLLGLLWVGLAVASLIAINARQPETFLVRTGTFTTPPNVNAVLLAGAGTVAPVALVGLAVDESRYHSPDRFQIVVVALLLLLVPLRWYGVLGPFGVFLRPDGVFDRQPLGSIFVPWEAGPAAAPTNSGVKLQFAHPELVVRRGLRPGTTLRTGADRGFTAWAINRYAARPDDRPAIGTREGLTQLESG